MYLNIGSHDKTIPGFVNIDLERLGDIQGDVTDGLPVRSGAFDGVYSEHFIEHIAQHEAVAFLRECRRVVRNGGRIRMATPDLDFMVARYTDPNWRTMGDMAAHGFDWVATRAEQLNIAMREWGHQWLYDEDELQRLGRIAGLEVLGRRPWGESDFDDFVGLEYRDGSRLVVEFEKRRPEVRTDDPLVSVLIAAWRPDFLDACLASAKRQTYTNLEILVGDDSEGTEVEAICRRHAADDPRISYHRNPERLLGRGNYVALFERSQGDYVKYLNDDDVLAPRCVDRMVRCLNALPDVTLVTSHRRLIDDDGATQPDIDPTKRPVSEDAVIAGPSAVASMVGGDSNWIGEPTTTMFRRTDVDRAEPDLFSFAGRKAPASVDMTLWTHLLSRGDLCYLVESLSSFRQHPGQRQRDPGFRPRGRAAVAQLRDDAQRMGLLHEAGRPLRSDPLVQKPWWSQETLAALAEADEALGGGHVARGESLLHEALAEAPGDPTIMTHLAALGMATGEVDMALGILDSVTTTAPWHLAARRQLASHAINEGDISAAIEHVRAILEVCPADEDAQMVSVALETHAFS